MVARQATKFYQAAQAFPVLGHITINRFQQFPMLLMEKEKVVTVGKPRIFQQQGMICPQKRLLKVHHTADTYLLLHHLRSVLVKNHALSSVIVCFRLLPGNMFFRCCTPAMHHFSFQTIVRVQKNHVCAGRLVQSFVMPGQSILYRQFIQKKLCLKDAAYL